MRTYGRARGDDDAPGAWTEVTTDAQGYDDPVYFVTLCQCLLLNNGESPFYANFGIPAKPSIVQQIFPDYDVSKTQQQFAPYFASLIINKQPLPEPTYEVNVTFNSGAKKSATVSF